MKRAKITHHTVVARIKPLNYLTTFAFSIFCINNERYANDKIVLPVDFNV